jgi:hypothetical protein
MLFIMLCWESPRWLYARGQKDKARRVLAEFHTRDGDLYSPLVELEIAEFEENISMEGGDRRFWDFKCLFKDFGSRYRFGLCFMVSVWGQLSGNGLVTCKSQPLEKMPRRYWLHATCADPYPRLPTGASWSCRDFGYESTARIESRQLGNVHDWCAYRSIIGGPYRKTETHAFCRLLVCCRNGHCWWPPQSCWRR